MHYVSRCASHQYLEENMERSLVLVKPDAVQRGLIGEIILRLERRGLRLVGAKFIAVSDELAKTHYAIHQGKPFFDSLIKYITSAPVMAMVWEGPMPSTPSARRWVPPVQPKCPGSIRHDFALRLDAI
jgi:nucleoside-diphosphate kinase